MHTSPSHLICSNKLKLCAYEGHEVEIYKLLRRIQTRTRILLKALMTKVHVLASQSLSYSFTDGGNTSYSFTDGGNTSYSFTNGGNTSYSFTDGGNTSYIFTDGGNTSTC